MVRKRRENAKLMIVQRIIQLNDTLVTEVTRWIRQINEIDTILNENSEIEEKDVSMSFRRKEFSQKYKELFKSIKMYDNDLKDRLSKLKESLERENKVLAGVLSQVRVREVTISASLFTSIVEHNKEQVRIYTDLHGNYWSSFFGNIQQVVGAFEEEVSEDSRLFVEKFSHLCEVLSSEYRDGKPSIEDLFHHLIECADMLNRYVPENNSKEVFIQGIEENPSAKKFADNYFNNKKVQNRIFSNKNDDNKLILKARDGFNAQGIDDEGREKLKKFTKDALKTLFIGIEEFKDKIDDLGGSDSSSSEETGSLTRDEKQKIKEAWNQIYSRIPGGTFNTSGIVPEDKVTLKSHLMNLMDTLFGGEEKIKENNGSYKCAQFSKVCKEISSSIEGRAKQSNVWNNLLDYAKKNYLSITDCNDQDVNEFLQRLGHVILDLQNLERL